MEINQVVGTLVCTERVLGLEHCALRILARLIENCADGLAGVDLVHVLLARCVPGQDLHVVVYTTKVVYKRYVLYFSHYAPFFFRRRRVLNTAASGAVLGAPTPNVDLVELSVSSVSD